MGAFVTAWQSVTAFSITLASLGASAGLVAGQCSAAVDFTALNLTDLQISGKFRTGTGTLTAGFIEVWPYGTLNDAPLYPASIAGTNSAQTFLSRDILFAALGGADQRPLISIPTDTTTGRDYFFGPICLARHFGGEIPKLGGLFVTHSTGQALDSTGGNHFLNFRPIYRSF